MLSLLHFIAEIKTVSPGIGGIVSLDFGSLLLTDSGETIFQIHGGLILTTTLIFAAFVVFVVRKVVIVHRMMPASGKEGLVGEKGAADSDVCDSGKVFVRGEYWDAWSDEKIVRGEKIVVIGVEGMCLKVKKDVMLRKGGVR